MDRLNFTGFTYDPLSQLYKDVVAYRKRACRCRVRIQYLTSHGGLSVTRVDMAWGTKRNRNTTMSFMSTKKEHFWTHCTIVQIRLSACLFRYICTIRTKCRYDQDLWKIWASVTSVWDTGRVLIALTKDQCV